MNLEIGQILSQVIAFLITVWVLKRFAWKPLLGIMEERRLKIKAEFDSIDHQKNELSKLAQDYDEKLSNIETKSRLKIQEAIHEGRKIAQEIQGEAHSQAREILKKAHEEMEREVEKAKMQLKNDLVSLTIAATEKLIQERLDPEKHQQLISQIVKDVELDK